MPKRSKGLQEIKHNTNLFIFEANVTDSGSLKVKAYHHNSMFEILILISECSRRNLQSYWWFD
jgi:hypothetical protein